MTAWCRDAGATEVMHDIHHRWPYALALAMLACLDNGDAQAAKAINVKVEQNGKVVLQGIYSAHDTADAAEAWVDLDKPALEAAQDIPGDLADPQQATLTGNIRIVVTWGREPVASAQVDRLRLLRVANKQWRLPRDEVERTAQVAGLELRQPASPAGTVLGGIAVCVIFGGVVLLFLRHQYRGQEEAE